MGAAESVSSTCPAASSAAMVNGPIFPGAPGGAADPRRAAEQTLQAHRTETAARARYTGQAKHGSAWASPPSAAAAELRSAELPKGPGGIHTIAGSNEKQGAGLKKGLESLGSGGPKPPESLGEGHALGGRAVPSFALEGASISQEPSEAERRLQNAERRLRALEAAEQRRRAAAGGAA